MKKGKIYVVGIGPGNMEDITIRAYRTLKEVDVIAGYITYVDLITKRVDAAASGDFIISLYNPKSKGRTTQIVEAREIMLKHKKPETPVALLRHVGREDENYTLTNLDEFLNHEIDMFTVVIIGNSKTYISNGRMITPRGYHI